MCKQPCLCHHMGHDRHANRCSEAATQRTLTQHTCEQACPGCHMVGLGCDILQTSMYVSPKWWHWHMTYTQIYEFIPLNGGACTQQERAHACLYRLVARLGHGTAVNRCWCWIWLVCGVCTGMLRLAHGSPGTQQGCLSTTW